MGIQVFFYLTVSEFKTREHFERKTLFLIFNVSGDLIARLSPTPHPGDTSGFIFTPQYCRHFGE